MTDSLAIDWTGDPDEMLTLEDAAALIPRADANTLKRLIRSGKLRAYRPGKKYLTRAPTSVQR